MYFIFYFTFIISKFRRICSSISVIRLVFSWPFDLFSMMMRSVFKFIAETKWKTENQKQIRRQRKTKFAVNFNENYLNELFILQISSHFPQRRTKTFIYTHCKHELCFCHTNGFSTFLKVHNIFRLLFRLLKFFYDTLYIFPVF